MDYAPLIASFGIIAISELGDKTQLATFTLASRYRPISVFVGAIMAFALVDGIGVLIGGLLAGLIPTIWAGIGSGSAFILFGVYTLLSKDEKVKTSSHKLAFVASFSLIALMELGDKTQLATIVLSARYASPILVFAGVMLAYLILTTVGIAAGLSLTKLVSRRTMKIVASAIFFIFGGIFLASALTGTPIF